MLLISCIFSDSCDALSVFSNIAAMSQAETQKRFESLKQEVEKRDADIRQLQRSLKESEGLLVSICQLRTPFSVCRRKLYYYYYYKC